MNPLKRGVQHIWSRYESHKKAHNKIHNHTKLHPRILILTPFFNQSEYSARKDRLTYGRTDGPTDGRTQPLKELRARD